jgi:hypothetical protein
MPDSVYIFWGIVGFLALAAGCNHGRHHAREDHLAMRLMRSSYRDRGAAALLLPDRRANTLDLDMSSGT